VDRIRRGIMAEPFIATVESLKEWNNKFIKANKELGKHNEELIEENAKLKEELEGLKHDINNGRIY